MVNVAAWAVLLDWMARSSPATRLNLTICMVYATLGEIFLSLGWELYDYCLGNILLFVPPGHALLFALVVILAARLPVDHQGGAARRSLPRSLHWRGPVATRWARRSSRCRSPAWLSAARANSMR